MDGTFREACGADFILYSTHAKCASWFVYAPIQIPGFLGHGWHSLFISYSSSGYLTSFRKLGTCKVLVG